MQGFFVGGWVIVGDRQTSLLVVVQGENQALFFMPDCPAFQDNSTFDIFGAVASWWEVGQLLWTFFLVLDSVQGKV